MSDQRASRDMTPEESAEYWQATQRPPALHPHYSKFTVNDRVVIDWKADRHFTQINGVVLAVVFYFTGYKYVIGWTDGFVSHEQMFDAFRATRYVEPAAKKDKTP